MENGIQAANILWTRRQYSRLGGQSRPGGGNRVAEALARAGDIDASNISVTSVGSQIVLQGTVSFPEEVAIAQDIASRVAGVSEVENLLATASNDNTREN